MMLAVEIRCALLLPQMCVSSLVSLKDKYSMSLEILYK